jgi:hypothetical protein
LFPSASGNSNMYQTNGALRVSIASRWLKGFAQGARRATGPTTRARRPPVRRRPARGGKRWAGRQSLGARARSACRGCRAAWRRSAPGAASPRSRPERRSEARGGVRTRCHGTHAARGAEAASQEPRSGAPSLSALLPCRAASPLHRRGGGAPCGGQLPLAVAAAHMIRHACQLDRSRGQRRDGGRGAGCDVGRGGRRGGRRGLGEKAEGARLGVSQPRGAHLRPSGWRRALATGAGDGWRSGLAMG